MSHAADLPLWAAVLVAAFLVIGAGLTLIGSFGLFRLRDFYDRIHAPTLGSSWGTAGIVMASMICFSVLQTRPVLHEFLVGVFVTITMPVTLIMLSRAALYRDRVEGNDNVPAQDPPKRTLADPGKTLRERGKQDSGPDSAENDAQN